MPGRPWSGADADDAWALTDVLDAHSTYERLDPGAMGARISALGAQAREAWDRGRDWAQAGTLTRTPSRVVIAGMGGSAIGADVVATLAALDGSVPVQLVRNYALPSLDEGALVVASSVSGETEETVSAFRGALAGPHNVIAITTGGTLARLATEAGTPLFTYASDGPPRTTFGFGVFALLGILRQLGVLSVEDAAVEAALAGLHADGESHAPAVPCAANRAKRLALALHEGIPVVIGNDFLEVAARRWAAQINENAKQWAFHAALPEVNHNLIVGFGEPAVGRRSLRAVLLDASCVSPRNHLRAGLTFADLQASGMAVDAVTVSGDSPLEAIVRACYLGDWVSYYLAMLNGVDPTPVRPIDRLKAALSSTSVATADLRA